MSVSTLTTRAWCRIANEKAGRTGWKAALYTVWQHVLEGVHTLLSGMATAVRATICFLDNL